jgi:hypothetical protein
MKTWYKQYAIGSYLTYSTMAVVRIYETELLIFRTLSTVQVFIRTTFWRLDSVSVLR